MRLLYSLSVNLYVLGIRISSLWNKKAKLWLSGRKGIWATISKFERKDQSLYWFHCASLGEFEQGRPLMESLKSKEDCQIVVTFFSPSGYEIRKNYEGADLIIYLPKDSASNARKFVSILKPTKAFFIKYEFWANYIFESKRLGVKLYSVSATFRPNQVFFKGYGGYMRKVLASFDHIFVQNEDSRQLLDGIGLESTVTGDTRFDRVSANAQQVVQYSKVADFKGSKKIWLIGSAWEEDIIVTINAINNLSDEWKVILAPHEIKEDFIKSIENRLEKTACRYSTIQSDSEVLIIDNIGMLMNLYQYGSIAYVGGAFRTGLHNILEPAAFGLPVIFGPNTEKFPEASQFIEAGVGFQISNRTEFEACFSDLISQDLSAKVDDFMRSQKGATEKILSHISN